MAKKVMGLMLAVVLLVGMLAGCKAKAGEEPQAGTRAGAQVEAQEGTHERKQEDKQEETPEGTPENLDSVLLGTAITQAAHMGELAGNEIYRSAYSIDNSLDEVMQQVAQTDYAVPEAAFLVQFEAAQMAEVMNEAFAEDLDSLPEGVRLTLEQNIVLFVYPQSLLSNYAGELALVASSALSVSTSLPKPAQLEGCYYVILLYDGDWGAFTVYQPGQGDTMMVYTMPVRMFPEIRTSLEAGELPPVKSMTLQGTVRRVPGEELAAILAAD